jgi:hypothetical protein
MIVSDLQYHGVGLVHIEGTNAKLCISTYQTHIS